MTRRRWALLACAAVAVVALLAGAASAWHYSSAVLVPEHDPWPQETEVEALRGDRIVLESTEESRRPGVHGLEWQGGRAIVGPILGEDDETVTRRLREVDGYLAPEMDVAFNPTVWSGDPTAALGVPSSTVPIRSELGVNPAWLVPGRERTWAIVVHGINATPQTGLRIVPALRRAGLPTLLITYREDLGAPESPDGFHHMGLTEWRDRGAAARYALAHGAERLVLVGYSMGGAIVAQFMQRSPLAPKVAGLVLDAPALDWQAILSFNATRMGFPSFLAKPVEWAIGARIDADWESLDAIEHPEDFQLPILLFHGTEDEVVPIATSDDFAAELRDWVTYFRVQEAGHTEEWNVDPRRYERRLATFLRRTIPSHSNPAIHSRIAMSDPDDRELFGLIADRVAERRNAWGLSQRELAELCGTTQSAIARVERGARPPRIDTLARIAAALDGELVVELRPRTKPPQADQKEKLDEREQRPLPARGQQGWRRRDRDQHR